LPVAPPALPPISVPPPVAAPAPVPTPVPATGTALSLVQFANTFQNRPGSHEVMVINPITNAPTLVRFTLPEGTARRVAVRRDEVVFHYGRLHFVRIEFTLAGATVISR
jgi:hypothetical protein